MLFLLHFVGIEGLHGVGFEFVRGVGRSWVEWLETGDKNIDKAAAIESQRKVSEVFIAAYVN